MCATPPAWPAGLLSHVLFVSSRSARRPSSRSCVSAPPAPASLFAAVLFSAASPASRLAS
eukprot:7947227-Pyramimonas_sp.AAC.1